MSNKYRISSKKFEKYPADLKESIIGEFEKLSSEKNIELLTTANNFDHISDFINEKTNSKINPEWLRNFYFNYREVRSKPLKIATFGPILEAFTYIYNYSSKTWEKLKDERLLFYSGYNKFKDQLDFSESISGYIGEYNYFLHYKNNPLYKDPYENRLEIFADNSVKIYNPFLNKYYFGFAIIRNHILQIISPDIENKIRGIGNILNFRINEYKRRAILLPGLAMTFDSENNPVVVPSLLCSDPVIKKDSKIVLAYFERFRENNELSCPSPEQIVNLIYEIGLL